MYYIMQCISILLTENEYICDYQHLRHDVVANNDYIDTESISKNTIKNSIDNENDINIDFIDEHKNIESEYVDEYIQAYHKYSHHFVDDIKSEPILSQSSFRYTVYPIEYQNVWNNYKSQLKINWVVEEVDLSKDIDHWNTKLSNNDRKFIMYVLAFFASADGIVNANIKENLIDVVKIKEAECAYGKQFEMENAHGEMYSLMLNTFVKDANLREKLMNSISTMPSIKRKAEWCKKWIDCDKTYAHKLIAFAIVEGVFFSGSFASIFWLKTRPGKIMPGFIKSNKFIARDEGTHVQLACILYSLLKNRLREDIVHQIIDEAVSIEDEFINESLPCKLLGMNSQLMSQYIRYVADKLLVYLGYRKKYNVENPFEYMKKIDTYVKTNFFEERNDEYSQSNIDNPKQFVLLQDF